MGTAIAVAFTHLRPRALHHRLVAVVCSPHTIAMSDDIFDSIRVKPRGKAKKPTHQRAKPEQRICDYPGCDRVAEYRAPKGRHQEGEFYFFCMEHVREYNKSYNYFSGMKQEDVAAYHKDAITGHRPTWKLGDRAKDPRAGSRGQTVNGKNVEDAFGAFMGAGVDAPETAAPDRPTLIAAHRRAFETLDLEETAEREEIRAKFKALVKRHHPDANGGDRSTEHRLRAVVEAYNTLKSAGFC